MADARAGKIETLIRQLQGALGGKRLKSGQVMVTWPGGSAISDAMLFDHGLPVPPTEAFGTLNDQSGTGFCFVQVEFDATQVLVQLATPSFAPANTTLSPVSWEVRG